jgi:hypothetical protein
MLTITSAAAGATLIGLGAAGTTLALWQDSELLSAPTIGSGSLNLTVEGADSYALPGTWTNLLPGDRIQHEVSVETDGTVASDVVMTVANEGDFVIRAAKGSCPGTPLAPTPATLGTWMPDEASAVCIEVSVGPTATQNTAQEFVVTFTATQLAS